VLRIGEWVGVVCEISTVTRDSESLFLEGIPGLLVGPQSQQQWLHLEQLARSEQPILIEGPTGTGKEVIARAIHQSSGRLGALVAINCAALPESLVEAQLFGHSKGAFTGAVQASPGLIASAEGGTVLLDEIAELPLSQQAKLLRAIEERAVLRVGETTPRPVNVRYVAACQQSLWRLCQGGRFRADLVGRLAGGRLRLLPLEQRREEIPRLFCDYFARAGGNPQLLTHTAIEALCVAAWPLNIRQVVQSARLAAVTCCDKLPINGVVLRGILGQVHEGEEPSSADSVALPQENSVPAEEIPKSRRSRWLDRHRGALADLLKALQLSGGNVSEACRRSGLPRWRAVRLLEVHVQENSAR
jgi:DNA-binding NtrC family response regulator